MFGYEEKLDWILKYEEKKRVIKERKRPRWRVREMPMQRGLRALDLREEEKYKYPLHDFPFATFNCLSFVFVFVFVGSSSLSVSLLSIPLSLSCLSSLIWDCIRIGHFFFFSQSHSQQNRCLKRCRVVRESFVFLTKRTDIAWLKSEFINGQGFPTNQLNNLLPFE